MEPLRQYLDIRFDVIRREGVDVVEFCFCSTIFLLLPFEMFIQPHEIPRVLRVALVRHAAVTFVELFHGLVSGAVVLVDGDILVYPGLDIRFCKVPQVLRGAGEVAHRPVGATLRVQQRTQFFQASQLG